MLSSSCCQCSVLAALFIVGYSLLPAQQALTLDGCIEIALRQSLNARSTENAFRSAQLAHREIGRSALPRLKLEGKALNAPNSDHFGYDAAITDGGQFSAQVGMQEVLFDGGARSLRSDQLAVDIERLRTEQRRVERDIRYAVRVAFFDLIQSELEVALQLQRVDDLSGYLGVVTRLFHGGRVNYTDVLKTEVRFENARVTLRRAAQTRAAAKVSLAEAMGMPHDTLFTLAGSLEPPEPPAADSLLRQVTVDSLHNLDLLIADFSIRRSMVDIDLARTERLPAIALSADVGWLSSGDNLRAPPEQRVSTVGYSIGVSIENLLFNWGMTDLRVQQQELEAANIRLSYEQQRRALVADAARLRIQLTSAVDQLESIDRTLKVAEDNYVLTKAQYAGGAAMALEVLSAEQLLAENRLSNLQTRGDLQRLIARIEQLSEH